MFPYVPHVPLMAVLGGQESPLLGPVPCPGGGNPIASNARVSSHGQPLAEPGLLCPDSAAAEVKAIDPCSNLEQFARANRRIVVLLPPARHERPLRHLFDVGGL